MTTESDIAYISGLLNNPASIPDDVDVVSWLQKYPYFTPLHYIKAAAAQRQEAFSPAMMSAMQPHMANWLLFCDFVNTASGAIQPTAFDNDIFEAATITIAESEPETAEAPEEEDTWNRLLEEVEETVEDIPAPHEVAGKEEEGEEQEVEYISSQPQEEEYPRPEPVEKHETTGEHVHEEGKEVPENVLHIDEVIEDAIEISEATPDSDEELILPVYTEDYFRQQGVKVDETLPDITDDWKNERKDEDEKSLMVMMSFAEWLQHFKSSSQKQKEESEEQRALKSMWQKEKLAAAIEEENDEIPEKVFEMAVNSITKEEDLASEPLAEIYIKQGKYDKAIDMYRKLSLRNPQKNAYFARKIEEILKEKQS